LVRLRGRTRHAYGVVNYGATHLGAPRFGREKGMAEGKVQIDATDWARIEVALAALPQIQRDLAELRGREFCVEHEACARAAFGARKFQYMILGALGLLSAAVIPLVAAWLGK
jgi:hypothetical protein